MVEHPRDVASAPDGDHLYTVDHAADTVTTIDVDQRAVSSSVLPVGREPTSIALAPAGGRGYVTNAGDGTLTVLNLSE